MNVVRRVVRQSDSASAGDPVGGVGVQDVEASLLPRSRRLARRFALRGMDQRYLIHLEHCIERNPRNLRAHAERVLMHRDRGDAVAVNGALVDLFVVLGENGRALRDRLLESVKDLLADADYSFLRARLENGLGRSDVSNSAARSCLSHQVAGTTRIVRKRHASAPRSTSLVELARESIANGDDDAALDLLEGALQDDPGRADVCRELLALYESGDYRERFFAAYASYIGRGLATPRRWRRLAYNFARQDRRSDPEWLVQA